MVAIYAVWYNFIRIHKTLRVTPAMAARLSKTLMKWEELIALMDAEAGAARALQERTACQRHIGEGLTFEHFKSTSWLFYDAAILSVYDLTARPEVVGRENFFGLVSWRVADWMLLTFAAGGAVMLILYELSAIRKALEARSEISN